MFERLKSNKTKENQDVLSMLPEVSSGFPMPKCKPKIRGKYFGR